MIRRPVDTAAARSMVLLCAVWAFQQIGLKLTATDMTPLVQVALRSAIAAALLGALMAWRQTHCALTAGLWRDGVMVGLLFAAEFFCLAEGLRESSAGRIVVLLYTAPIFAALWLHWRLPEERLNRWQWCGIALAFSGLLLAFSDSLLHSRADSLRGDALGLLAGLAWGSLTAWVRCSRLSSAPAELTLLFQLIGGALLLLIVWGNGEFSAASWSTLVGWNLLFQGVVVSFVSYLVWFQLLRCYQVSQLGIFSLLTPVFGVALSAWILDEALNFHFIAGGLLVLLGVLVVMRGRHQCG